MTVAAFFDRDGTININFGHVYRIEDLELIPTIPEIIKSYNDSHIPVIVVTNQAGIAKGLYTERDMRRFHQHMNEVLGAQFNAHIDAFYFCPHHPEIMGPCTCRKPEPGLFFQAARDWGISGLHHDWLVHGNNAKAVHYHILYLSNSGDRTAWRSPFWYCGGAGLPVGLACISPRKYTTGSFHSCIHPQLSCLGSQVCSPVGFHRHEVGAESPSEGVPRTQIQCIRTLPFSGNPIAWYRGLDRGVSSRAFRCASAPCGSDNIFGCSGRGGNHDGNDLWDTASDLNKQYIHKKWLPPQLP